MRKKIMFAGAAKGRADASDLAKPGTRQRFHPARIDFANFKARHFLWKLDGKVATIALTVPNARTP